MQRKTSWRILALALAMLATGCANDAPNVCKIGLLTDLPLQYRHVLVTPASLNDQPTTMMLDTGAAVTVINKSAAERLHLPLQTTGGWIGGIGGKQDLYYFAAKSFRIGQLHGTNLLLGASELGIDPHHKLIDGIFGADFLSRYDIDLDLPEHKLRLFKVVEGCNTPTAELDQPLYLAKLVRPSMPGDPRAHVIVVIGGVRLNAVVDSGAQGTAIFRNSARRLGLRLADLTGDVHGRSFGVGPEARDVVRHVMTPIQIGEITIANLPVGIIDQRSEDDTDMLLGLDFLARVHVWLSFHSQAMLMQYPPKPSPKLQGE